ncbi:MAG: glycosyltransferase, partial [Chloroflexi bacterium]|nr:glycosyltransferase [Chloroflexota bacterium]
MKLVFVFYQFYPNIGGTEIPMLHYAKELVSRGHDVIVCTANCRDMKPAKLPGEEVIDGITVKRFKYLPLPLPYFFFTPGIIPYLWKSKSDAVQVFAVLPSFMLFAACAVTKLTGKRLVLYPQSYPNRFGYFTSRWKRVAGNLFDKTIARLFLKMADHVIALTD